MKRTLLTLLTLTLGIAPTWAQKDGYIQGANGILQVLSFNIRYDNAEDGINRWDNRKDRVANLIVERNADLVGAQEVLHHQLEDLQARLPEYGSIGVGRTDGKAEGEYAAIFYRKSRFEVQETGNFWLSPTPDVVGSRGWDAHLERIVTWAKFVDNTTGNRFLFVNTHFDHAGETARRESVALLLHRIDSLSQGIPVILTGDFNADYYSDVVRKIINVQTPHRLIHSRMVAEAVNGPAWSFHYFGRVPIGERPLIDHVFITPHWTVMSYSVLAEPEGKRYYSDHCAVWVQLLPAPFYR